jgi:DNA transformation protein and related proteins
MAEDGLIAWVTDALAPLGTVSQRRMMGGHMLYLDGIIFAIVEDGELWFKADGESDARWDAAGCIRFTYTMGEGRTGTMNYRRVPADCHDDADALQRWAALAVEAGRRTPRRKPRKPV